MSLQAAPATLRILQSVATLAGARDSLESINTSQVSDRAIVAVVATNTLYMLRHDSVAASNPPLVIVPAQGGTGRWFEYSSGAVDSVFGRTGIVVAVAGDYDSDQVSNASAVPGVAVSDALDALNNANYVAPTNLGNLGATPALDFAANRYLVGTVNANATVSIAQLPNNYECYLELVQPAAGGPFVVSAWDANIDWTDGLPPVLSTAANAIDLIRFTRNGTKLRGWVLGLNLS